MNITITEVHKAIFNPELIRRYEDNLLDAVKSSDVETIDELLHDNLLFIAPDGSVITKFQDLDAHRSGLMKVEEADNTIESIQIIEDTAIVILTLNTKGTMLGKAIDGKFRYIRIWKLFGKSLKVIGGSCIKIM